VAQEVRSVRREKYLPRVGSGQPDAGVTDRADEGTDAAEERGVERAAVHREVTRDVLEDEPALVVTATRLGEVYAPVAQSAHVRDRESRRLQPWLVHRVADAHHAG
jgi:hypothetical protein